MLEIKIQQFWIHDKTKRLYTLFPFITYKDFILDAALFGDELKKRNLLKALNKDSILVLKKYIYREKGVFYFGSVAELV